MTTTRPWTRRGGGGFTLMELMIVVAILGVIASIAVPRLGGMIRRANEAATKGKLGSLRSALSIYYADSAGAYPGDLSPMMQPGSKYLSGIMPVYTYDHGNSEGVVTVSSASTSGDGGGWAYVNNPLDAYWGRVWVDCTHTDIKGRVWTDY